MAGHVPQALQIAAPLVTNRHHLVRDEVGRERLISEMLICWATSYEQEKDTCPICFEEFASSPADEDKGTDGTSSLNNGIPEWPVLTPCMHRFGSLCLRRWLLTSDSCPLCRRELIYYGNVRPDDFQSIQRPRSVQPMNTFPSLLNPLGAILTPRTGMEDTNASAQTSLDRSSSTNSNRDLTFQQQLWQARMGGLSYTNTFYSHDIPRNLAARSDGRRNQVRSPLDTTPHGHPSPPRTQPATVAVTEIHMRRHYIEPRITSYHPTSQPNNTQSLHHTAPDNRSRGERWRNGDHASGTRRRIYPRRDDSSNTSLMTNAARLITSEGAVADMPNGERSVSPGDDNARSTEDESSNEFSLYNALGHILGVLTVTGMPRAEWRDPQVTNTRTEGQENRARRRVTANSSIEDDLAGLPRLASSMWAPSLR